MLCVNMALDPKRKRILEKETPFDVMYKEHLIMSLHVEDMLLLQNEEVTRQTNAATSDDEENTDKTPRKF